MKKMKNQLNYIVVLLNLIISLCFSACTGASGEGTSFIKGSESSFSIQFIDVGQGDSALIECDGQYMLIDGGDTAAGDKVYSVLEEKGIQRLNILAISHLHADHIGGLEKALRYASKIDLTISNSDYSDKETFRKMEHQLGINGATITVPHVGDTYNLGSAKVEVIDVSAQEENDSLVLLITYGKTKFLFTGDIEDTAQKRIADKYSNDSDEPFSISLMKMPHHGSYSGTLYTFVRTFMPEYVIISVGKDNPYGHPHKETLDLLNSKSYSPKLYRTDMNGDIIVKSDGKTLSIETMK